MSSLTADTYRRYKEDTESMLIWLSNSLKGLDMAFDGRLEDASITSKYMITFARNIPSVTDVQELPFANHSPGLLELASYAKDGGAIMPCEVIYSLEHALKLRRQYHAWYSKNFSGQSSSEDIKRTQHSNGAHAAYIDVLQCIHDLFAPAKTQASHSQQSSSPDKKILEFTNLFARLEVEEMAEMEQQSSTTNSPSASAPAAKPLVQKKARMLIEDKILELYCLYDDANKIRDDLRNKWAEYSNRKIDFESVSLTTQVALELFAEVETAFELKHSTILKGKPGFVSPKYADLYAYLATGELLDSIYFDDTAASLKEQDEAAAQLQAQQRQECERKVDASSWQLSDNLRDWVGVPPSALCDLQNDEQGR